MSTNSVVAIGTKKSWNGVYVHWDGYPSWMGHTLMEILQDEGGESAYAELISEHPQGWSVVGEKCYCHSEEHKHNRGSSMRYTKRQAAGQFSWAYVFDPDARVLHVLKGAQRVVASLSIDDEPPTRAEWKQIENTRS